MKIVSKKHKPKKQGKGFIRSVGNKLYLRYKGKDIKTGCDDTPIGWEMAEAFRIQKVAELEAIDRGERPVEDSIRNVFERFLNEKIKFSKITPKTTQFYKSGINAVFKDQDVLLSEKSARQQIQLFIENTNVSDASINIYLRAVDGFLNWASDSENNNVYIPRKKYTAKYKRKINVVVKEDYGREDYNLLLSYFENQNEEMYLLIQFLWLTGARVGESLTIKLNDLDLKNNRISLSNKIFKGQREYLLLIPEAVDVVEKIKKLADLRGDDKLFSWKDTRLPNKIMERAEHRLGLKIEGRGLHGFRRGFCERMFEIGLSIPDVQAIMRHRNIATTIKHYKKIEYRGLIDKMAGLK